MKIRYGKISTISFVGDISKDSQYSLEIPASAVFGSKEINTFRFGVENVFSFATKKFMHKDSCR